jgi:hypothetical protein
MEGIIIEAEEREVGYFSILAPAGVVISATDVLTVLTKLGGRRRHTTDGTPALREALFSFLSAHGNIGCYFCSEPAVGLHRYFIPFCDNHGEPPAFCTECGTWSVPDDFDSGEDSCTIICADCVSNRSASCDNCGEDTTDYESVDGEILCRSCYDNISTCANCGHRLGSSEDEYCSRCQRTDAPIHEAHAKVVDILGRSRYGEEAKDRVYFGIELELEVSHTDGDSSLFQEAATAILDALGRDFIILKTDGSLGDGGIEINTLPCTLKVQREKWEGFFAHKPSGLTSWKNNRCGIHIHITRQPLGMLTIGKMTVFLNDPKNKDFIKQIAGRYDASYSKVKPKKITDTAGEDRYEMLNLTSNRTIEMRIFKGTLNKRHFLADVEFAHALVHFCRTTSIRYLDTAKFMQFLRMNRKDYPNLYAFSCKEEKGEDE